jgi:hypothetical protein
MPSLRASLLALGVAGAFAALPGARCTFAEDAGPPSPWMLVPVASSSPKLGTAGGALAAYLHKFDPDSRVSIFGATAQYTTTDSLVASAFARTSFGADHHRITLIGVAGRIRNDYDDYLGTGEPLQTRDEITALALRYQYRVLGKWWLGAQGSAANYQVLGESAEDDLALETLGVRGFKSVGVGLVVMHDSRDSLDMPTRGIYVNANNVHYSEALGGADTFDAYRADVRAFWPHGAGHVLAVRQYNWLTRDAPFAAQSTVVLRGYKQGEYLEPYMSSLEAEYRRSLGRRWGATAFAGVAKLYGEDEGVEAAEVAEASSRSVFPMVGAGVQFILKPVQRMLVNLEYAQGVEGNHGVYLKFGYAW